MKTIEYVPRWRHATEPVQLVTSPTKEWMEKHKEWGLRFALMPDGEIYFGDSYTVLHKDMCAFKIKVEPAHRYSATEERPVIIGVLFWGPTVKRWRVCFLQWFMTGASDEPVHGARFLRRVIPWADLENMVGPFDYQREEILTRAAGLEPATASGHYSEGSTS
jgi:hypothetical protein